MDNKGAVSEEVTESVVKPAKASWWHKLPPWQTVVVEMATIVLGVLLGFMANEWRETQNQNEVVNNALTSVASEMRDNHFRIMNMYVYYREFIHNADSVVRARAVDPADLNAYDVPGWRGAMPPMIRSSSYDMMIHSGIIKDVPFQIGDNLSRVYNMQQLLKSIDDAFISKFTMNAGNYNLADVRNLFHLYYEVIPSLLGHYQYLGKPHLLNYGYDLSIDDEELKKQIEYQMGGE